ncbi:unnamed protein product, partial [Polarella glacialis]
LLPRRLEQVALSALLLLSWPWGCLLRRCRPGMRRISVGVWAHWRSMQTGTTTGAELLLRLALQD